MTATPERCPRCDQVRAVENGHPGGCLCESCVSMCWRDWGNNECGVPAVDWRARCLAAESARDAAVKRADRLLAIAYAAIARGRSCADDSREYGNDPQMFDDLYAAALADDLRAALSTPTTPDDPRKQPDKGHEAP